MGYDIYFTSVADSAQTPKIHISYNYNHFYVFFNLPHYRGKSAVEMVVPLKHGISELERLHHSLLTTKDQLNATPGNYHSYLKFLLSYAKAHPAWVFHCE